MEEAQNFKQRCKKGWKINNHSSGFWRGIDSLRQLVAYDLISNLKGKGDLEKYWTIRVISKESMGC